MKKIFLTITTIMLVVPFNSLRPQAEGAHEIAQYDWAVVGAGFAGITALAVLLDAGVEPSKVAWIDPEFNVGRVGNHYCNVPGNVQTQHLTEYVEKCPYFKNITSAALDRLYTYEAEQFQLLHVIVEPLLDFTAYLQNMVVPIQASVSSLDRIDECWHLQSDGGEIKAEKVILAIGAHPKRLDYDITEIPLDDALDKEKLANMVSPDDSIAVFGGMHSAILVLKFLSESCVGRVINFYLEDYFYDSPGLEGVTALWAREVLEKQPPVNLSRVKNTDENRGKFLPLCNKAIYAIGYESNKIMINGSSDVAFDERTGTIDEDLYGIGIAFPPTALFNGHKIAKNGLYAYLIYAKKLMPRWVNNEKAYQLEVDDIEIPWI